MPKFSRISKERLLTCTENIQAVMHTAILKMDFSVQCGHRGKQEQDDAYASGASQKRWPKGKHNSMPSKAVDIAPYPYTEDKRQWYYLAGFIMGTANALGVRLRWGGDWDMDDDVTDNRFMDLGHFEVY